eukprot:m.448388 g.448388  ORF g.448388 m.448388 type:complete len:257 (-) comp56891_c0_seq16:328-1098(-)
MDRSDASRQADLKFVSFRLADLPATCLLFIVRQSQLQREVVAAQRSRLASPGAGSPLHLLSSPTEAQPQADPVTPTKPASVKRSAESPFEIWDSDQDEAADGVELSKCTLLTAVSSRFASLWFHFFSFVHLFVCFQRAAPPPKRSNAAVHPSAPLQISALEQASTPPPISASKLQPISPAVPSRQLTPTAETPSKARKLWTSEEIQNLRDGVAEFGEGMWSKILLSRAFQQRTSVDLKDKWRNLKKSSADSPARAQ